MKKIILLICLCLSCVTMNAQKWYASATTGCDTYTNLYKDLKFGKTLAPTAAIAVGRDHNPYLGTRLEVRVGNALFSDGELVVMYMFTIMINLHYLLNLLLMLTII